MLRYMLFFCCAVLVLVGCNSLHPIKDMQKDYKRLIEERDFNVSSYRTTALHTISRSTNTKIDKPELADIWQTGGVKITLHLSDMPIRMLVRMLINITGGNIIAGNDILDKRITLRLYQLPWRDALQSIANAYDIKLSEKNRIVVLDTFKQESNQHKQWHTDIFRLFYSEPNATKEIIESLFSQAENKPIFSVDNRTRSLFVRADADMIKLISRLINSIDIPTKQVRIEAFIVEAGEDFEHKLGVRLGINRLDANSIRIGGVVGSSLSANDNLTLVNNIGDATNLSVSGASAGIGLLLDSARLKFELTALENEGKSRIISNPKIFTLDNHEAVIFQGDEVPYFTISEQGTQTQFKEAGISLTVTPNIIGDGNLIMDIAVSKDTVDTRIQNPPITRRKITTKLKVADGAVVIIGGIYFNTGISTSEHVPVLGKLPIIGGLFRRTQKAHDIKELLIFISPKIIS